MYKLKGDQMRLSCSIIIATRNRALVLETISLPSIIKQTYSNFEVIIWDASDNEDTFSVYKKFALQYPFLDIKYYKAPRRGLASQRNDAVKVAKGDILLFIDDDISIEENFLEELIRVYNNDRNKEIGGVQGVILTPSSLNKSQIRRFVEFCLNLYYFIFLLPRYSSKNRVLISGRYIGEALPLEGYKDLNSGSNVIETDLQWLSGCCMSYIKEIFDKYNYRFNEELEKFGGYAYMEDGDFSYRVYKMLGYKLARMRSAKCIHYHVSYGRDNLQSFFSSAVYNWFLFWNRNIKLSPKSFLAFIWSQFGFFVYTIFYTLMKCILNKDRSLDSVKGLFIGYSAIIDYIRSKKCIT